jgi:hypothetical protein
MYVSYIPISTTIIIQDVQMKGIQNKIIVSQKAFIIQIYGLHLYKEKLSVFFSEYKTFSLNFIVGSLGDMTNIQTIWDIIPCCLKHVWCYHSHSIPCAGYQVLKVIDLNKALSKSSLTPHTALYFSFSFPKLTHDPEQEAMFQTLKQPFIYMIFILQEVQIMSTRW